MPSYEFLCKSCKHEYEEFQWMSDPFPDCPNCKSKDIQRLISGGSGRGIVELTGHELKAKMKEDIRKLKSDINTKESVRANLIGENRYESIMSKK